MYKNKQEKELFELLEGHQKLTFQSQIDLLQEFETRGLMNGVDDLKSTISDETARIKNLDYIGDLGFKVKYQDNGIIVTRNIWTIITDISAIVLGLLFTYLGVYGLFSLVGMFLSDVSSSIVLLIRSIIYMALGLLGVRYLNGGVKRFFDYIGFEISSYNGWITLKKRFDLNLEKIEKEAPLLKLEQSDNRIILKLDGRNIMNSKANNIVQRMTIEELYKKLKNPF